MEKTLTRAAQRQMKEIKKLKEKAKKDELAGNTDKASALYSKISEAQECSMYMQYECGFETKATVRFGSCSSPPFDGWSQTHVATVSQDPDGRVALLTMDRPSVAEQYYDFEDDASQGTFGQCTVT